MMTFRKPFKAQMFHTHGSELCNLLFEKSSTYRWIWSAIKFFTLISCFWFFFLSGNKKKTLQVASSILSVWTSKSFLLFGFWFFQRVVYCLNAETVEKIDQFIKSETKNLISHKQHFPFSIQVLESTVSFLKEKCLVCLIYKNCIFFFKSWKRWKINKADCNWNIL